MILQRALYSHDTNNPINIAAPMINCAAVPRMNPSIFKQRMMIAPMIAKGMARISSMITTAPYQEYGHNDG